MSKVLVCGSVSYDTISVFPDNFTNHINLDQNRGLDMAFHVSELREEYGGCAVNICYNLKLLGCDAAPMATVGNDFDRYEERLTHCKISLDHIQRIQDINTAHYFLTTDKHENQIVVFHAGAMQYSYRNHIKLVKGIELGVIAPDSVEGMKLHATQFVENGIPFMFDPGPTLHLLGKEELKCFIEQATWVIMNHHEWELFYKITDLTSKEIIEQVDALIITKGSQGSKIFTKAETIEINALEIETIKDPAGCGDAYRAGIIFCILNGLGWKTSGQMATLMGKINLAHAGAQNHHFSMEEFCSLYESHFNESLQY